MLTEVGMKGVAAVLSWCFAVLVGAEAAIGGVGSKGPTSGMASRCFTVRIAPPMDLLTWEGGGGGGWPDHLTCGPNPCGMG